MISEPESAVGEQSSCKLCAVTRVICFWGERTAYKPWKRAFALFGSLALLGIAVAVFVFERPLMWYYIVLAILLGLFAALGMIASIWGCNRCVVRMFGDI